MNKKETWKFVKKKKKYYSEQKKSEIVLRIKIGEKTYRFGRIIKMRKKLREKVNI